MNALSKRIKDKREGERLSAEELAQMLTTPEFKVTKENIYKWERGSKPSEMEVYQRIIDWLDKSESSIISEASIFPLGGLQRTLKDYVEKIERDNAFLQKLLESSLVDISDKVRELISSPAQSTPDPETVSAPGRGKFAGMSHKAAAKTVDVHPGRQGRK